MVHTQTQIISYEETKKTLQTKHTQIIDALHRLGGTATDRQISVSTSSPRSLVAARRRELVLLGSVLPCGETYDNITGRTVTVWRLV